MRMQKFQRGKGGSGAALPVIGTQDPDPNGNRTPGNIDNMLSFAQQGPSGQPVRNVLIGLEFDGSYVAQTIAVWYYETSTGLWMKMEAAKSITATRLFFRFLCPSVLPPTQLADGTAGSAGGLCAYVQLNDSGSAATGTYTVLMAPDAAG